MGYGQLLAAGASPSPFHRIGSMAEGALPMFVFLLGIAALAALAVWYSNRNRLAANGPVYNSTASTTPASTPRDGAEGIARERLARGEITAEEYERILSVLRQ